MKTIRNPAERRLFDPFEGVISQTGWKQIEDGWQSLDPRSHIVSVRHSVRIEFGAWFRHRPAND